MRSKGLLDDVRSLVALAVLWSLLISSWFVDLTDTQKIGYTAFGVVLATVAAVLYLIDVVTKQGQPDQTLPHPVMWGFWTAIGVVNTLVSWLNHPGPAIIIAVWYLVLQLVIFGFSLKKTFGKAYTRSEIYVAVASVLAFALWQAIPAIPAVVVAAALIICDAVVSRIQVQLCWNMPWTESTRAWVLSAPAATMGIFALSSHEFAAAAYPVYLAVFITVVASAQLMSPKVQPSEPALTQEVGVSAA